MSETSNAAPTFSRNVRLEDFLDEDEIDCNDSVHQHQHQRYNEDIPKHQQNYGPRKRIKP